MTQLNTNNETSNISVFRTFAISNILELQEKISYIAKYTKDELSSFETSDLSEQYEWLLKTCSLRGII